MNVLDKDAPQPAVREDEEGGDPEEKEKTAPGAVDALIIWTPDGRLTWLQAWPRGARATSLKGSRPRSPVS